MINNKLGSQADFRSHEQVSKQPHTQTQLDWISTHSSVSIHQTSRCEQRSGHRFDETAITKPITKLGSAI